MARWLVHQQLGRVLQAIRDAENRVMFCGYNPLAYKPSGPCLRLCAALLALLYVPQVGIINPSEMSPARALRSPSGRQWGRATLIGPIVGAFFVNGAKSWFTVAFPEFWLYFLGPCSLGSPVSARRNRGRHQKLFNKHAEEKA